MAVADTESCLSSVIQSKPDNGFCKPPDGSLPNMGPLAPGSIRLHGEPASINA